MKDFLGEIGVLPTEIDGVAGLQGGSAGLERGRVVVGCEGAVSGGPREDGSRLELTVAVVRGASIVAKFQKLVSVGPLEKKACLERTRQSSPRRRRRGRSLGYRSYPKDAEEEKVSVLPMDMPLYIMVLTEQQSGESDASVWDGEEHEELSQETESADEITRGDQNGSLASNNIAVRVVNC